MVSWIGEYMESRYKRDHGYSYGEMIQKQDALTVSELTEGVFSEWDDNLLYWK